MRLKGTDDGSRASPLGGFGTWAIATPIIHFVHGNRGRVGPSLALRLVPQLAVVSIAFSLGITTRFSIGPDEFSTASTVLGIMSIAGRITATVVDAAIFANHTEAESTPVMLGRGTSF